MCRFSLFLLIVSTLLVSAASITSAVVGVTDVRTRNYVLAQSDTFVRLDANQIGIRLAFCFRAQIFFFLNNGSVTTTCLSGAIAYTTNVPVDVATRFVAEIGVSPRRQQINDRACPVAKSGGRDFPTPLFT
jgi:hypothetical protein